MKRYRVSVSGYGSETYDAASRGKALAQAYRTDAFGGWTFKKFLTQARVSQAAALADYGREITVSGKPAFYLNRNSQYIRFVFPGSDVVLNSHPLDVEPDELRPPAYRTTA